jgi:hypothetical protein
MQLGWAKDIGGSGGDSGNGVAVDNSGNVYTTGIFTGAANFNPNAGTTHYFFGGGIFVSKLDANGNYVAAANLASNYYPFLIENGCAIALDGAGNVYTTGWFSNTENFDPTGGTYDLTAVGQYTENIFVSKLTQPVKPLAGGSPSGGSHPGSMTAAAVDLSAADLPTADAGIDWLAAPTKSKGKLFAAWLADGQ